MSSNTEAPSRRSGGPRLLVLTLLLLLLPAGALAQSPAPPLGPTETDNAKLNAALERSEALMRDGKFEEAMADLDQALQSYRASWANLARLHLMRGVVQVLLDRPIQARAAFATALCFDRTVHPAMLDPSPVTARIFEDARATLTCTAQPPTAPAVLAPAPVVTDSTSLVPTFLMVSGGVLVAAGSVLGVLALRAENRSNAEGVSKDDATADSQQASDLALGADVCLFGGLATAGTGIILLLLRESGSPTTAAAPGAPATAPPTASLLPFGPGDGPGLGLVLSF
jgi:hypothetical protein